MLFFRANPAFYAKAPGIPPALEPSATLSGMDFGWYRHLFEIGSKGMSFAVFARVAISVAVPLFGFILLGHPMAGVAGGATAMFVSMSDIGTTRHGRTATMAAAALLILIGGFIGDKFGGTTFADEGFILVSAAVAGWVSNSHPGIAAAARFGALATAAGAGMQVADPIAAVAVVTGGAVAIGIANWIWFVHDVSPDENLIDWRAGVRRAFSGADSGPWFAVCYAAACALSLLAAEKLGVRNPYWATFTVIMSMRREGTVSLGLVIHYMAGTLLGIPVAALLAHAGAHPLALASLATLAAALGRLGFAVNPALGYMAFTVFLVLVVEIAAGGHAPAAGLVATRLYDVGVGCAIALVATLIATIGRRPTPAPAGSA